MSRFIARETTARGEGRRFAVVASRFNAEVVDRLLDGATRCLADHGVAENDIEVVRVPGAWEIPLALDRLAAAGGYDGLVALGAVVRGETAHFDYICNECSRGIGAVSLRYGVPVGFGLLTCETMEQAMDRAGGAHGDKGEEAALAALEMADLVSSVEAGWRSRIGGFQ